MAGPDRFHLVTRLPSGEPVDVPLAPLSLSGRDGAGGLWLDDDEA